MGERDLEAPSEKIDLDRAIIDFLDNGTPMPTSVATPAVGLKGNVIATEVYVKPQEEIEDMSLPPRRVVERSLLENIVIDAYHAIPRPNVVRRVAQAATIIFTAGAK